MGVFRVIPDRISFLNDTISVSNQPSALISIVDGGYRDQYHNSSKIRIPPIVANDGLHRWYRFDGRGFNISYGMDYLESIFYSNIDIEVWFEKNCRGTCLAQFFGDSVAFILDTEEDMTAMTQFVKKTEENAMQYILFTNPGEVTEAKIQVREFLSGNCRAYINPNYHTKKLFRIIAQTEEDQMLLKVWR